MTKEAKTSKLRERFGLHFEWVLPIFLRPRRTLQTIIEQEKPVWFTPLLLLSGLAIIANLIAWPIRRNAIINGFTLPTDFQYYSTDQQAQIMASQATQSSALFTFIFPVLGALITLWLSWFLMSSILHMSHFIAGSSADKHGYFNLVAWSMSPIILRYVIQILAMLISHKAISAGGISGFITGSTGGAAFLAGILGQVDIYFIWQIILLVIGVIPLSGLTKAKSWTATGITLLVMVLLLSVPHLVGGLLSGVASSGV